MRYPTYKATIGRQRIAIQKRDEEMHALKLRVEQLERQLANREKKVYDLPEKVVFLVVNEYYPCPYEVLQGQSRKMEIRLPRQLNMYFLAKYSKYSLEKIGSFFGKKHDMAIHSRDAIKNWIDTDKTFRNIVAEMDEKIMNKLNTCE